MNEPAESAGSDQLPADDIRYARQIRFAGVGRTGQQALSASKAAVVGMGALGSVIAQHLVRSGIGFVRIIDRDIVEWSNLQRQMLYGERDVLNLLPKAEAAAARLRDMNSSVAVEPVVADVTADNAASLLHDVDVILDGTDNFSVRYLLNEVSAKYGIPWIYGGAVGGAGATMTVRPGITACYRCLFPETPAPGSTDTCETAGILSPVVDIIASHQALEAIKLLTGQHSKLHGKLMQLDFWNNGYLPLDIKEARRPDCPVCGRQEYSLLERHTDEAAAASLCGRNTIQITPSRSSMPPALEETAARLQSAGHVTLSPYLLRLERPDGIVLVLFPDGRALVQGTDSPTKARAVYAEILGI
ncbi:ThiF family adenylyltransferase [Paenibacillus protaetiae]|uniref:Thiazole biosynthesis adenylyltransferase ThiF n=1 Tax=Paenibacillus protaetiae TaxID=2509456 RepID=A0A4P6ESV9_9BACL|nr:ThiF family adenylyltransferase [Paenibacillus protaetiae]QAY65083.1 thiazole biosynthesis adenylyltransferase ThiF [Paenibacillus protaetiae]